jgi:hypothetical protein
MRWDAFTRGFNLDIVFETPVDRFFAQWLLGGAGKWMKLHIKNLENTSLLFIMDIAQKINE